MVDQPDERKSIRGHVDVAESAIVDLVRDIVRGCYGVVGIGQSARSKRSLNVPIPRPWQKSAIGIVVQDGRLSIRIPVIIEYGTPVATVARNVIQSVGFQVQQTLGLPVERVDVCVSALRRSPEANPSHS